MKMKEIKDLIDNKRKQAEHKEQRDKDILPKSFTLHSSSQG